MYYAIVEEMDFEEATEYDWELIDGQKRYRWYKNARNSVHLISACDANHDIDNQDFSDLKLYYDSVEWVAKNDPEALIYIMGTLTKPVTQIVKDKLLYHLAEFGYYKSCAVVKEHLASYPAPPERTFERKKKKAIKDVEENIVEAYKVISERLYKFKTEEKQKLYDKNFSDAFGSLLNIWGLSKEDLTESLPLLEWLFENSADDLKQLFSLKLCEEIKDQFLQVLAEKEMYKLHTFINEIIETPIMDFYYDIPPYNPTMKNRLIMPDFEEEDDDV